jgi:hypothetical protein
MHSRWRAVGENKIVSVSAAVPSIEKERESELMEKGGGGGRTGSWTHL